MIEHVIALMSNPWTWVLIVFSILLPFILIFIRRFYPVDIQDKIVQCELKTEKNIKSGLKKQENKIFFAAITVLTLLISMICIGIELVLCSTISQKNILNSTISAGIMSLGIITIFYKKFYRYALREKYKNYFCASDRLILKYLSKSGYLFIAIGLFGFIKLSCIGETFNQKIHIQNIRQKEIIILEKKDSQKNIHGIKINVSGTIKGQSEISLILNDKEYKTDKLNGDFSIDWKSDWYSNTAKLIYQPINVKKGNVCIRYEFNEI